MGETAEGAEENHEIQTTKSTPQNPSEIGVAEGIIDTPDTMGGGSEYQNADDTVTDSAAEATENLTIEGVLPRTVEIVQGDVETVPETDVVKSEPEVQETAAATTTVSQDDANAAAHPPTDSENDSDSVQIRLYDPNRAPIFLEFKAEKLDSESESDLEGSSAVSSVKQLKLPIKSAKIIRRTPKSVSE